LTELSPNAKKKLVADKYIALTIPFFSKIQDKDLKNFIFCKI